MPPAIYALALGIFTQGTSEFMLSGLLPGLADDLGVTISDAGLLISGFAIGMLIGAPLAAAATLRLPHRTTLIAFQAVFIAGHVAGALAPDYGTLFVTRIVSAVVYAGYWGMAVVAALALVPPEIRGRAVALVSSGLSLATVIGVPAGTYLGQQASWRAAFWAVAACTVLSLIAVALAVPRGGGARGAADGAAKSATPGLRAELRALRRPRYWLALSITALTFGTVIASFSYLAPILTENTGLPEAWVPAVLALFGLGALIGLHLGGRSADRRPFPTLYLGLGAVVTVSAALALLARHPAAVIVLVFLLGLSGFLTQPTIASRVFVLAPGAPTLAGAFNTSAFNTGITVAPALGGAAIAAGWGNTSAAWVGAALGLTALAATGAAQAADRRAAVRKAGQGEAVPAGRRPEPREDRRCAMSGPPAN
ncbi:Cmx/CmrA family chloramphenicol efflux MFS transporter [Streptomyces carpaticus]|uniref:Cmx/CmrA family chloramphenicol efflux MFS transporter n=1 Tax=Streptomyces carpaticus TaxID=285558 RepID=A0ABV4ZSS8_9ACTN